jgi:lysophospholipase L1-like esterase
MNEKRRLWLVLIGVLAGGLAFWPVLSSVQSAPSAPIVAIGDSITWYSHSHTGSWPDDLSRLLGQPVLNRGIGGNAVVAQYYPSAGPALITRFASDASAVQGVRTVIVLDGHNDIRYTKTDQSGAVVAGLTAVIAEAHAAHVRVLCGTLVPFGHDGAWTPARERERDAVNTWIHTSRVCDGVIDFARILADPRHPLDQLAAYNSGDGIHPNAAGEQAMAHAAYRALQDAVRQ